MEEAVIRKRLIELSKTIARLPSLSAVKGDEGLYISQAPCDVSSTEATLSALTLQIKYLLFDLEATRRENHYLRQMLNSRPGRQREDERDKPSGP